MKKNNFSVLVIFLTVLILTACVGQNSEQPAPVDGESTLYVAPFWKTCVGVGPTLCLQVRETSQGEWINFHGSIAGFNFEPSNSYKLLVKKESIQNPPADGSSIRWTLIEEQSKSTVEMPRIDLTGTEWSLVSNSGTTVLPDTEITLDFPEAGRVGGNAGCNGYGGDYALQGVSFTPGMMMSTLMACEENINQQESAYLAALQSMQYLQIEGEQLLLVSADGQFLQFKTR